VRLRNLLLVSLLGFASAMLPALASSETTPKIEAVASSHGGAYGYESYAWSPMQATIGAGGSVTFSTGTTSAPHGIVWTGGPATPSCAGTVPVGATNFGEHWTGSCTFSQPGTYTFHCSVHTTEMTGTIVVNANGTTTTTTTTSAPPTSTTTPSPTSTTPATPPPSASHPTSANAKKLAKALKACKKKPKGKKRAACIKRAHKRYGVKRK